MAISVIISTYNSPDWLEKTLWGYKYQTFKNFEIIIADDGSTSETVDVIKRMQNEVDFLIKHVWHEDIGFRKCEIMNLAIQASTYDYLVFSDGDCIPRNDFLETHQRMRKPNHFLSGGYFKLPMHISQGIDEQDISSQNCFELTWLKEKGLKVSNIKSWKLTATKYQNFLNWITPTNASWDGHNASGWKKDALAVNGFNEKMRYGAEDREFGERMMNKGVKPIQIRYSAICVHLDHKRGYVNREDLKRNAAIRKVTKSEKLVWTNDGIVKSDAKDIKSI